MCLTLFVLLHQDHGGECRSFIGVDGGTIGPSEQRIWIDHRLFDGNAPLSKGVDLSLRATLPFLKSLGETVFVSADLP